MGVAYAVKSGDMQLSDVDVDYREAVKDLVDGMTLKKLKDFAATKHDGLPERVPENIQAGQINGMGPVELPADGLLGSGDVPAGKGDAEEEYKKKKRKMRNLTESYKNDKDVLALIDILSGKKMFTMTHKEFMRQSKKINRFSKGSYDHELNDIFDEYKMLNLDQKQGWDKEDWLDWLTDWPLQESNNTDVMSKNAPIRIPTFEQFINSSSDFN